MICDTCSLGMTEGVPHSCTGTLFDRVRRKAERLSKKSGKPWTDHQLRILYDMLDPGHNAGENSPDNKYSPSDVE